LASVSVFAKDKKALSFINKTVPELIQTWGIPQGIADASNGYMVIIYMDKDKRIRFMAKESVVFYYDIQTQLSTGEWETLERYERVGI